MPTCAISCHPVKQLTPASTFMSWSQEAGDSLFQTVYCHGKSIRLGADASVAVKSVWPCARQSPEASLSLAGSA